MKAIYLVTLLFAMSLAAASPSAAQSSTTPPGLPAEAQVLLVGDPRLAGALVEDYEASFAMGPAGEHEDLAAPRVIQKGKIERLSVDGREVLRRSNVVQRADNDEILATATIDMDPVTLKPLSARTEQGGQTVRVDYDWDRFVVRREPGAAGAEFDEASLDLPMLEVGAHDVWMSALPLSEGFEARLPAVFAATGTKYWAVPRVVGSERVDLGAGKVRDAWVVELDWWGMGAANTSENHSTGGGEGGTAGPGGKYWVVKQPVAGEPRVVRVRTEAAPEVDSVVELRMGD